MINSNSIYSVKVYAIFLRDVGRGKGAAPGTVTKHDPRWNMTKIGLFGMKS